MLSSDNEESPRGLKRPLENGANGVAHYDPTSGQTPQDYMSQLLLSKRQKMTQPNKDAELASDSAEDSDDDSSESDDDSDEDSDEETLQDTSPSTAGVIEKIVLKNFMCHESFELSLGPQINFIIGRNGSGKSAILTGISVGLGAKASDTSRGTSIKSLIKDGKSTARVSVTLANRGEDAYHPQEYGDKIIIERKLQRQGAHGYYIRGENGKTVSTKKQVLDDILNKFNITVDNPLAFLSQDKAREFLTTTTDQSKYAYFMSGSSIEDILQKYSSTSQNVVQLRDKLTLSKSHLKVALKRFEEAEAMYNQRQKSRNLRAQLQVIHGKVYWFNVTAVEKKIESFHARIEQLKNEIEELDSEANSTNQELLNRSAKKQDLQNQVDAITKQVEESTNKWNQQLEEVRKSKDDIKTMQEDISAGESEIRHNEREILESEAAIKKEQDTIDQQQGGSKEALRKHLNELRSTLEEKEQAADDLQQKYNDARSEESNASSPELAALQAKVQSLDQKIEILKKRKLQLLSAQKDRYAPWGSNIHSILKEIRATRDWHKPPLGPIGSYVSMKQGHSKWHDLVNTIYGKALDSFLVCDEHDRKLLMNILRKIRTNKNIVVRKYEKYDYSRGKPEHYLTVSDILNVENEDVFFTLIDFNNIERDVLCDDQTDAQQAVKHPKVGNAYCRYDSSGANKFSGNERNIKLDPVMYNRQGDKLSRGNQVTAEDISMIDREIDEAQVNRAATSRESRQLKIKEEQLKKQEQQVLRKQLEKINHTIKQLNNEIFKIENQLNDDGDMGRITALNIRIQECREQINNREGIISGLKTDLDSLKSSYSHAKRKLAQMNEQKDAILEKREEMLTIIKEFDIHGAQLDSNLIHFQTGMDKRKRLIEEVEAKIAKFSAKRDEILPRAEERCRREEAPIGPEDTSQSISEEFQHIQMAVQEAENRMGKPDHEVQKELSDSKDLKERLEQNVENLSSTEKSLDDDLANRFDLLRTTFKKSVYEATTSFEESLALRGFTGELRFAHHEKSLKMFVKTPNDHQMRTVESLSGGEKSFTQIALLLAIWRVMNSKVRGLDEFDVFMDSVNRTISIRLLLKQLQMYPKSQSIFITPQDITTVADIDRSDVKIHQISAPRGD